MSVLGRYSFVFVAVTLISISLAATWRIKRRWLRITIPSVVTAGLLVAFLMLRTGGGNVHSVDDLDTALASGRPVMLEMYSDY